MIKKSILNKIQSKYIFETIFDYVKYENFKTKLFTYSKFFQNKLLIEYNDYKEKYISQIGINFDDYLCSDYNSIKFNKDLLKNVLIKELSNFGVILDDDIMQIILVNYFKKHIKSLKNYNIDIYTSFLDILLNSDIIENFTIKIMLNKIKKYDLLSDYVSFFDKLNVSNKKYPPLKFYYKEERDLDYFYTLKVDMNNVKTLIMINEDEDSYFNGDYNFFFENFFSLSGIQNNLVNLELFINTPYSDKTEFNPFSLENLNNFNSLKQLKLYGFKFTQEFLFKLSLLEILELTNCKNITFNDGKYINLKKLILNNNSNLQAKSLLKLPILEECELKIGGLDEDFKSLIDYSSLKNLKICKINSLEFLNFKSTLLNKLSLYSNRNISSEEEKEILEKIISVKTLKEISFEIYKIKEEEILKIKDENSLITKAEIIDNSRNNDFIIHNLQNKFPNVTYLGININSIFGNKIKIEIEENSNCKINTLSIIEKGNKNIKFSIKSFEELVNVSFNLKSEIINIKDAFPIFSDKCLVIFQSLTDFEFECSIDIKSDIINNLYKNIGNMPNLVYFKLHCVSNDLKEDLYKKLIKKLISMKLDKLKYMSLVIKNNKDSYSYRDIYYSLNELKEIFPEINEKKLNKIYIKKFK